ncbi:MAG: hypothetical protein AB7O44_24600 [Hyphomicrobiaceae bacterium]
MTRRGWERTAWLVAAAVAALLLPEPAQSTESGNWEVRRVGTHRDGRPHYARVYCRSDGRCYRPRQAARPHSRTRVYSYVRREGYEDGPTCREMRRAVGDQHLTLDGAKKAANDSWAGTIRFHLGEKFMDLNNARHVNYTCSRSSIKEGGVTTLGQTFTRCEVEAQPCHPPREVSEK